MTDANPSFEFTGKITGRHTDGDARTRLRRRYAAEFRFKVMGAAAVAVAALFLVVLLSTIVSQAIPAFRANVLQLAVDLSPENVDPANVKRADYDKIVRTALLAMFPQAVSRQERKAVRGLVSTGSGHLLRRAVAADASILGSTFRYAVPVDDFVDLYLKGLLAERSRYALLDTIVTPSETSGSASLMFNGTALHQMVLSSGHGQTSDDGSIRLTSGDPSYILEFNGGVAKLRDISAASAGVDIYRPLQSAAASGGMRVRVIEAPEAERKISDREIVWIDGLKEDGLIENRWNTIFFTGGASREPELAGIWGAVVGSALTMLITLLLSFPVGVSAAIYLEEFAPKNRWTRLIEVNINNLAAVPSIVFGLLGLAVFLNWFALPRSAPLVGGMVLALMTLPTIIIASRAAIRAVPPSIREAALGIGASKVQTVFHHVLPLAMPGILTGTIIGMAQALGETAPLLMIGMVAFIVDIPGGFTDAATVLPVQVFMWADFPEPGFQQKTAAAILILLGFLVMMNALAVFLRKRFERRW